MQEKSLIIIQGPTGVGKSSIAEALAEHYNGEIISADSRQVYRHLNIGTAKPDETILKEVKYHLINIVSPVDEYNAGDFCRDALAAMEDIRQRGKTPIIVGGTGFYISALLNGLAAIPPISDAARKQVAELFEKGTPETIYGFLKQVDPDAAAGIERNDLHRQQRALEVFTETGTPISAFWKTDQESFEYNYVNILLMRDRAKLYERINKRVDNMLAAGLIDEIRNLLANGFAESDPGMNTVGYREFYPWLKGEISLESAIDKMKQHSRNYAKRQITWYKKQEFHLTLDINSLSLSNVKEKIDQYVKKVLEI